MSEYRNKTTGEVKSQGEWRKSYPNTSFPRVWTQETLNGLNLDAVLRSPTATVGEYQTSVRDGVKQDALGNWVENHVALDMFTDTTEDGVVTTKAEHEVVYQAGLDEVVADSNRTKRDGLLTTTDFYALTDVTMNASMTTYRQALRDISSHANWPVLDEADWPIKP